MNALIDQIIHLKGKRRLGSSDVALRLGISEDTVEEIWKNHLANRPMESSREFFDGNVKKINYLPASHDHPEDNTPIRVSNGKSALVVGDFHCPYQNIDMLERSISICKAYFPDIKTAILGGDLFDFPSISKYDQVNPAPDPDEVIASAGDVLKFIGVHFGTVYTLLGNHDSRLSRKINRPLSHRYLIDSALGDDRPIGCKYIPSNSAYMTFGKYMIGHPSNYSGQGGKTPSEYAEKYHSNVITFHNHVTGSASSKSGEWIGIDAGHLTLPEKHLYQELSFTKFVNWSSGFVIIHNNFPYIFTEKWTDWNKWLGDNYEKTGDR